MRKSSKTLKTEVDLGSMHDIIRAHTIEHHDHDEEHAQIKFDSYWAGSSIYLTQIDHGSKGPFDAIIAMSVDQARALRPLLDAAIAKADARLARQGQGKK